MNSCFDVVKYILLVILLLALFEGYAFIRNISFPNHLYINDYNNEPQNNNNKYNYNNNINNNAHLNKNILNDQETSVESINIIMNNNTNKYYDKNDKNTHNDNNKVNAFQSLNEDEDCPPDFPYKCLSSYNGRVCFNHPISASKCSGEFNSWCSLPHAPNPIPTFVSQGYGKYCYCRSSYLNETKTIPKPSSSPVDPPHHSADKKDNHFFSSPRRLLFLTSDTRMPYSDASSLVVEMTQTAMLHYISLFDYELHFYGFYVNPFTSNKKDLSSCKHKIHGERYASWCKLQAILHGLYYPFVPPSLNNYANPIKWNWPGGCDEAKKEKKEKEKLIDNGKYDFDYLVYLDTDAAVMWESDFEFIMKHFVYAHLTNTFKDNSEPPPVVFGNNLPYNIMAPNAGIMIIRNSPEAKYLFHEWWNTGEFISYHRKHEYEQIWIEKYYTISPFKELVSISLNLSTMTKQNNLPIQHFTSENGVSQFDKLPYYFTSVLHKHRIPLDSESVVQPFKHENWKRFLIDGFHFDPDEYLSNQTNIFHP